MSRNHYLHLMMDEPDCLGRARAVLDGLAASAMLKDLMLHPGYPTAARSRHAPLRCRVMVASSLPAPARPLPCDGYAMLAALAARHPEERYEVPISAGQLATYLACCARRWWLHFTLSEDGTDRCLGDFRLGPVMAEERRLSLFAPGFDSSAVTVMGPSVRHGDDALRFLDVVGPLFRLDAFRRAAMTLDGIPARDAILAFIVRAADDPALPVAAERGLRLLEDGRERLYAEPSLFLQRPRERRPGILSPPAPPRRSPG